MHIVKCMLITGRDQLLLSTLEVDNNNDSREKE